MRNRKFDLRIALTESKGGIVSLPNGMVGATHALWKAACRHGFNGSHESFQKRILHGVRDWAELVKPVNAVAKARSIKAFQKQKQDPEFLAALAAVAARRVARA